MNQAMPAQPQQQQGFDPNTQISLNLALGAVNIILAGLGELKAKEVGDLPTYIRAQVYEQLAPKAAAAPQADQKADAPGA
jgi:hypothetical protein